MSETLEMEPPAEAGAAEPLSTPAPDAGAQPRDVEAEARRLGWVPRAEFRGDPANWRPAEEYLERGMTLLPVLQQNIRTLTTKFERTERQLDESRDALRDMTERMRKTDERAYQRALRDVEARRREAVANGDEAAFQAADAEMTELRQSAAPPAPAAPNPAPAGPAPEVVEFVRANPWFNTDPEARADAIAILSSVDQQYPHESLAERLARTRRKVAQLHPALFENPRRAAPAAVAAASAAPARNADPRSFDAMPADSKREYERYVKALAGKGNELTKDEWAKYYWENG